MFKNWQIFAILSFVALSHQAPMIIAADVEMADADAMDIDHADIGYWMNQALAAEEDAGGIFFHHAQPADDAPDAEKIRYWRRRHQFAVRGPLALPKAKRLRAE